MGRAVAKKPAKIPDRVYPRDLHGILVGLWDNKPFFRGWPNLELPPKAVFDLEIIDVCYHASMLTEEAPPDGVPHRLPRPVKAGYRRGTTTSSRRSRDIWLGKGDKSQGQHGRAAIALGRVARRDGSDR